MQCGHLSSWSLAFDAHLKIITPGICRSALIGDLSMAGLERSKLVSRPIDSCSQKPMRGPVKQCNRRRRRACHHGGQLYAMLNSAQQYFDATSSQDEQAGGFERTLAVSEPEL